MKGLTDKEVIDSRKKNGSNVITKVKKDSFFKMLISTLGDPIIKILLIALAIKTLFLFSNFDWYETVGIVIAIFLASFISTLSEYGSEKAFEKLEEDASKIKAKVKRGSVIKEVCIDDIVCGDLVILQAGDKICADGIILSGNILVNESNLNGEMKEKAKVSKSKVYRSTVVYSGRALMKVLKVGDNTVYGKLAREVMEKGQDSPLKIRLTHLAKQISKIGYMGALLVSISYLFYQCHKHASLLFPAPSPPLFRPARLQFHFHPASVNQFCIDVVIGGETDRFDRQKEVFIIGNQMFCRHPPEFSHSCFHPSLS